MQKQRCMSVKEIINPDHLQNLIICVDAIYVAPEISEHLIEIDAPILKRNQSGVGEIQICADCIVGAKHALGRLD